MCRGCVHVHVTNGEISKVFLHLTDLPTDGVIHLSPDDILTNEQFLEAHSIDANEVHLAACERFFDLGDDSVQVESS